MFCKNKKINFLYFHPKSSAALCLMMTLVWPWEGASVCTRVDKDKTRLQLYTQDKVDTRVTIYVVDWVAQWYRKVTIRMVDTGVVILTVAVVVPLDISELWIAFGTGKAFRYTGPTQLYYISVKEPHLKIDTLKLNTVFTSPLDNKFSYTELCACVSRRMCTIKKKGTFSETCGW